MKRMMLLMCVASALVSSAGCNLMNRHCNQCNGPIGCRPCNLGWQRGGTDYQRFLGCNHCGGHCGGQCGAHGGAHGGGHGLGHGGLAGALANNPLTGHGNNFAHAQPSGAGPASGGPMAQVAYPYYTVRGPRDFFLDNPPTIGR